MPAIEILLKSRFATGIVVTAVTRCRSHVTESISWRPATHLFAQLQNGIDHRRAAQKREFPN
jgi:hypothetical protein